MKKLTTQEFVKKSRLVHGCKYDYSEVEYQVGAAKVKIICQKHGSFYQTAYKHLDGRGCPLCTHNNIKENENNFYREAKNIHNNKYDYSLVKYKNARTKVKIICLIHGIFEQTPDNHLRGCACPKCMSEQLSSIKKSSTANFVSQAKLIHNNFYNYLLVNYETAKTKVKIICPKHGIFNQTPDTHLRGSGCSKCVKVISGMETLWLDLLHIPNDINHRQVNININGRLFKLDGFDPMTKTAYEFYGDYWHGNPNKFRANDLNLLNKRSFGDLYTATIEKEKILKDAGYTVISIWEQEFKKKLSI